ATASRNLRRPCNLVSYSERCLERPCCLGDRPHHFGLTKLLKRTAAELLGARMARQEQHRRLGRKRRIQGGGSIGMTRTAGDERDAHLTGDPRVSVGHVHARRFVAAVNELDARLGERIVDGHDVIARHGKHAVDADLLEGPSENVGAAKEGSVSHAPRFVRQKAACYTARTPAWGRLRGEGWTSLCPYRSPTIHARRSRSPRHDDTCDRPI